MSTILPQLPSPPAGAAAAAPPVLTVAAGDLPDALASLPAGSQIEATVLPPQPGQPRNLLEVDTAAGPLLLRSRGDVTLPPGATLTLQLTGDAAAPSLRLVAVNGRTLLPGGLTLAAGAAAAATTGSATPPVLVAGRPVASPPPAAAGAPAVAPSPAVPAGLVATLLRPAAAAGAPVPPGDPVPPSPEEAAAAAAAAPAEAPPSLAPGTQFIVRIAELTPPPAAAPAAPAAAPVAAAAGQPESTVPAAVPSAPAPAPASGAPPPPPGGVSAAIAPAPPDGPGLAPPLPPDGLPDATLTGTVTAHASGNQALVETPLGTLSLPAADQLPVGSGLTLDLLTPALPPAPAAPVAPPPQGLGPAGWQALDDAAAALVAAADVPAVQQLVQMLPQLGPQMAATLSAFASALRSGDIDTVIGDRVVRGLEKAGRRDLADRLKGDVKSMADQTADPVGGGDWTRYTLPLFTGARVEPVTLYVRRVPGQDDEGDAGIRPNGEHRFVVDVALSRLGRIQLDGLVQREAKRFDLIIRTAQPLLQEMRYDILGLFAASSEAVGTKGSVTFQPGGRFAELPPAPPPATSFSV